MFGHFDIYSQINLCQLKILIFTLNLNIKGQIYQQPAQTLFWHYCQDLLKTHIEKLALIFFFFFCG